MTLKPWYRVVVPREDLRDGRPLDAAEFAVHLDQVRDGRAPADYQDPSRFFDRTYLTANLTDIATQTVRRLSGEKTETSAVFNLATQFGGGKTHSLTLLYHLARHGPDASTWKGVPDILRRSGQPAIPRAAVAVFVSTEFDSLTGRGGDDGTPLRKTPWGEIAWQLAGQQGLDAVAEHEARGVAPVGDVIRRVLPDGPVLILFDELMNYISRSRSIGLATQFYDFLQNLSEEARGQDRMVVAVSVPASQLEMTADDQGDHDRIKKLLDRVGKAMTMADDLETSEIIRRRLFEWGGLPPEARAAAAEYAAWLADHRGLLPSWFTVDGAQEVFEATYPFHPAALSVFERKWRSLPRFQQTRGVLRLMALWVSHAYRAGFKNAEPDLVLGLGSAPLGDPLFRAAALEQLGEPRLESAITTDIAGKPDAHAGRLDAEAVDTIRKCRLHQKVATAVFFESNGGQMRDVATEQEVRLAVGAPGQDIGNVETVLDALVNTCYYLHFDDKTYRFQIIPAPAMLLNMRRMSIPAARVTERVREEVVKVFVPAPGVERVFFPERSNEIPDRPVLSFVVLDPAHNMGDQPAVEALVGKLTREYGTSARTFKSGLIWCVADIVGPLERLARDSIAWTEIYAEADRLGLEDGQVKQVGELRDKAQRDLREAVWRAYRRVLLLGKDGEFRDIDLGFVTSSAAESLTSLILFRMRQEDEVTDTVSPKYLVSHWPPAFTEWSTRGVRDAFYASPQFPRLLQADEVRDVIARGVNQGFLAYVGKLGDGTYQPFHFNSPEEITLQPGDRRRFTARGVLDTGQEVVVDGVTWSATGGAIDADGVFVAGDGEGDHTVTAAARSVTGMSRVSVRSGAVLPPDPATARRLSWAGDLPVQKWSMFYMKVLSRFAATAKVRITLSLEIEDAKGITDQRVQETQAALLELGLGDDVTTSGES